MATTALHATLRLRFFGAPGQRATPRTITGQVKEEGEAMPDLLTIALGVLFAAGTLLHAFKALENEATAHDDDSIKSGKSRKG